MKLFASFIQQLSAGLKKPLPGETAHRVMEASSAKYLQSKPNAHTRKSAVLILFYPHEDEIHFPLILRASYGVHSGQIAFPGGAYETTDQSLVYTALREAQEEVGVKPAEVKILGTLTEVFISVSNFLVLPVVGYSPRRPLYLPNNQEVDGIFEVRLADFSEPNRLGCGEILIPGDRVRTPHYTLEGHKIWGATAKMISELLVIMSGNSSPH